MQTYLEAQAARSTLKSLIRNEHLGLAPNAEATLRQILQMNGFNVHSDVLHGQYVSQLQRILWQMLGFDPDSEDEVYHFLQRDSVYKLFLLPEDKKYQNNRLTPCFNNEKDKARQKVRAANGCKPEKNVMSSALDDDLGLNPKKSSIDESNNPMGYCQQGVSTHHELKISPQAAEPHVESKPKKRKKRRRRH